MSSPREIAARNRPTLAGAVTGVVASFGTWGVSALPDIFPDPVTAALYALVAAVAALAGGIAGKIAQRHTWSEETHLATLAEAYAVEPPPAYFGNLPALSHAEGM